MLAVSPSQAGNRLLAVISAADLNLLQPHLNPTPLNLRQELERPFMIQTAHTAVANARTRKKLIRTGRGESILRNRKGIERAAGNSYGMPEAEFRRLIS